MQKVRLCASNSFISSFSILIFKSLFCASWDTLGHTEENSNEAKDNVGPTGALTSCRWGRYRAKPPQDVSLRTPQAKHCPGHETQPPSQTVHQETGTRESLRHHS